MEYTLIMGLSMALKDYSVMVCLSDIMILLATFSLTGK
jgi:hypothetical protein